MQSFEPAKLLLPEQSQMYCLLISLKKDLDFDILVQVCVFHVLGFPLPLQISEIGRQI